MAKKSESTINTYRVLRPVHHDKTKYIAGDAIKLTGEQAAPLLVLKHIDIPAGPVQLVDRDGEVEGDEPAA